MAAAEAAPTAPAAKPTEAPPTKEARGNGDIEASWPVLQPPKNRGKRLFLVGDKFCCCPPYILFVPIAFVVGYTLGLVALAFLLIGVVAGLVLVGLPAACGLWSFTYFWRCAPFNWVTDLYTRVMYLGIQGMRDDLVMIGKNWSEVVNLDHFRPKGPLAKDHVDLSLQIEVPKEREEEFDPPRGCARAFARRSGLSAWMKEHLFYLPQVDHFDAFEPDENPVEYVMKKMGHLYPAIHQDWPDKYSDESLSRFCLYGLGAHRIEVEIQGGTRYYVVRTNALSGIPVRPGFARYGGDAYFDAGFRPVKIVDRGLGPARRDGQDVETVTRPTDPAWAEAKFRFRSSLSVLVTLVDHLYGVHLQVSNLMVTAAREQLSPDHPLRRFLAPFMYQTIQVNSNARNNLVKPRSLAPRCFAFTKQGFQLAFAAAPQLLRSGFEVPPEEGGPMLNFATYADYMKDKYGIDTEWFRQGKRYYSILREYLESYLAYFYPTRQAVVDDPELHATLLQFSHQLELVTPAKMLLQGGVPSNVDQKYSRIIDMVTSHMFWVSAMHEQVGAIEAYVQDVAFCAFKWVPGALVGTKQTAIAQALLMSSTSAPMPFILGTDWTHIFKGLHPVGGVAEGRHSPEECYRRVQLELQQMADYCDRYNESASTRPFPECFPLVTMHPKLLEMSCSL